MPKQLFGAVADFIKKEYGGAVGETENVHVAGLAVTSVLGNDPERLTLLFVNLSANEVYVGLDAQVATTRGIRLAANGGSVSMVIRNDLGLPARAWFALATGAASNLYVLSTRRISVAGTAPDTESFSN